MDTKESRSTKFQYFAALSANIIMLGYGCGIGWVAVALPLLQSVDTPLTSGILSLDQKALLSSILSIGSLSGNFVFGFLVNYLGSKRCMLIAGFVQAVSHFLCNLNTNESNFKSYQVNSVLLTMVFGFSRVHGCC